MMCEFATSVFTVLETSVSFYSAQNTRLVLSSDFALRLGSQIESQILNYSPKHARKLIGPLSSCFTNHAPDEEFSRPVQLHLLEVVERSPLANEVQDSLEPGGMEKYKIPISHVTPIGKKEKHDPNLSFCWPLCWQVSARSRASSTLPLSNRACNMGTYVQPILGET